MRLESCCFCPYTPVTEHQSATQTQWWSVRMTQETNAKPNSRINLLSLYTGAMTMTHFTWFDVCFYPLTIAFIVTLDSDRPPKSPTSLVHSAQCYFPYFTKPSSSVMAQQKQTLSSEQFRSLEVKEIHSATLLDHGQVFWKHSVFSKVSPFGCQHVATVYLLLSTTGWFFSPLLLQSKPKLANQPQGKISGSIEQPTGTGHFQWLTKQSGQSGVSRGRSCWSPLQKIKNNAQWPQQKSTQVVDTYPWCVWGQLVITCCNRWKKCRAQIPEVEYYRTHSAQQCKSNPKWMCPLRNLLFGWDWVAGGWGPRPPWPIYS